MSDKGFRRSYMAENIVYTVLWVLLVLAIILLAKWVYS